MLTLSSSNYSDNLLVYTNIELSTTAVEGKGPTHFMSPLDNDRLLVTNIKLQLFPHIHLNVNKFSLRWLSIT